LSKLFFKGVLVFYQVNDVLVVVSMVVLIGWTCYILADKRYSLFFGVPSYVGGRGNNLVFAADRVSVQVEVSIELEDLSLELGSVPMVEIRLGRACLFGPERLGSLRSVHFNVAYLETVIKMLKLC
jgi:hypothetical protein